MLRGRRARRHAAHRAPTRGFRHEQRFAFHAYSSASGDNRALTFWVENGEKTAGESVCDVKARGRELRVMSAGVGAVSVRPLELCLWGGLSGLPAVMRGSGAGCAGWPVRGSWRPGPPPRAARAERVPARGAAEAGRRLGLLGPLASVVPRPPRGGSCPTSGGRAEWCQGETGPAVSSISRNFHNDATRRNCKRYVSAGKVDWQCMDQSELSFETPHSQELGSARRRPHRLPPR